MRQRIKMFRETFVKGRHRFCVFFMDYFSKQQLQMSIWLIMLFFFRLKIIMFSLMKKGKRAWKTLSEQCVLIFDRVETCIRTLLVDVSDERKMNL